MKNKLIVIGIIGTKIAYLNLPEEEAIRRFIATEKLIHPDASPDYDWNAYARAYMTTFEFVDEFDVYDAEPISKD